MSSAANPTGPVNGLQQKWPAADELKLRELLAAGHSATEVAALLGRTPSMVWRKCSRIGIRSVIRPRFEWNEEACDFLRALAVTTMSSSQMAKVLSEKYGHSFTRNTIVGKIHRLGIARPAEVISRPKAPRPSRRRSRPALRVVWSAPPEAPTGPGVSFVDLERNHCRYIAGEPNGRETVYCGSPGEPWCAFHRTIVHYRRANA